MGKELRLDMGNNLQGEWNTDTQSMQKVHMCTFTASATEPLKYLTNQGPLPFAPIHFSTPTSRNHIGGAKRFLTKGIENSECRPLGITALRNGGLEPSGTHCIYM